ncbi:ABZJ_00895 family protein [Inhella proteolytica]|uniref:ABZJ_00895 family protein n=1 Tax=Inhella proteolytica TaxID=2795029 RepID=A0A931J2P1_9BURK|nr:ABZJ_00895 family protein [Inhella proteolytica]MBH9578436.1 ABZJ_00895 family protein [Inhella proteolytica]
MAINLAALLIVGLFAAPFGILGCLLLLSVCVALAASVAGRAFARSQRRDPSASEVRRFAGMAVVSQLGLLAAALPVLRGSRSAMGYQLSWLFRDSSGLQLLLTFLGMAGVLTFLGVRHFFGLSARRSALAPNASPKKVAALKKLQDWKDAKGWQETQPAEAASAEPVTAAIPSAREGDVQPSSVRSAFHFLAAAVAVAVMVAGATELFGLRTRSAFWLPMTLAGSFFAAELFVRRHGRAPDRKEADSFAWRANALLLMTLLLCTWLVTTGVMGVSVDLSRYLGSGGNGSTLGIVGRLLFSFSVSLLASSWLFRWYGSKRVVELERRRAGGASSLRAE